MIEKFYPELIPAPIVEKNSAEELPETTPDQPAFDFRAEMREIRVNVDAMLADGKIEEAESYMDERRRVFIENGYNIRRLNQAYFAFHGAYADQPGGAAGEDPVGEAVRNLRAQSNSLAEFVKRIAWVTSYERLQKMLD